MSFEKALDKFKGDAMIDIIGLGELAK